MQSSEIADVVALGLPVLCFDTCTALDLIRNPTSEDARPHEREAALELLAAAESGSGLVTMIADQVAHKFDENCPTVEAGAIEALRRLKSQVDPFGGVDAVYGRVGWASLDHLDDHVARARTVVDRWIRAAKAAPQGADVAARAVARMLQSRAPAGKGKDSMKECVVIEAYLELVYRLRPGGFAAGIVFASSNVNNDMQGTDTELRAVLAQEFAALGLSYAPNLAAAKFTLGL